MAGRRDHTLDEPFLLDELWRHTLDEPFLLDELWRRTLDEPFLLDELWRLSCRQWPADATIP